VASLCADIVATCAFSFGVRTGFDIDFGSGTFFDIGVGAMTPSSHFHPVWYLSVSWGFVFDP